MRKAGIVALTLSIALVAWAGQSATASDESVYSGMIDQKIARCQLKGKLISSSSQDLRKYGRKAADQATFYQENKAELADMMAQENISAKPHSVSHFLIKSYNGVASERQLAVRQ